MLEKRPDLRVIAEASNGPEALRLIKRHQPDVALIESELSRLSGFEVAARVNKECPSVHVIVLSTHADEECLQRALGCGAAGYLTTTATAVELAAAIKAVANGKTYVSSAATKTLMDFAQCEAVNETCARLTIRQREILKLIAEGNSTKQIALVLKINVKTVETHRMLLANRLGIHHTAGLVRFAIRAGLIGLED
jgi:DNA-binding NarL/FixJ family response regulator